jgi:flagellar basal body rod protein FlgB
MSFELKWGIIMELDGIVFGQTYDNLEKAIKASSVRQKQIAANIANIESGNFDRLDFQSALDRARIKLGNKEVLMDQEMTKFAENNLRLTSYANLLSTKLKNLKKVVTLGKGG